MGSFVVKEEFDGMGGFPVKDESVSNMSVGSLLSNVNLSSLTESKIDEKTIPIESSVVSTLSESQGNIDMDDH